MKLEEIFVLGEITLNLKHQTFSKHHCTKEVYVATYKIM